MMSTIIIIIYTLYDEAWHWLKHIMYMHNIYMCGD